MSLFCVVSFGDIGVSQQPPGANGTYTHVFVVEDKANITMHTLDLPGCGKDEKHKKKVRK